MYYVSMKYCTLYCIYNSPQNVMQIKMGHFSFNVGRARRNSSFYNYSYCFAWVLCYLAIALTFGHHYLFSMDYCVKQLATQLKFDRRLRRLLLMRKQSTSLIFKSVPRTTNAMKLQHYTLGTVYY